MKRAVLFYLAIFVWTCSSLTASAQTDYWAAVRQDYLNRSDISQEVRDQVGTYNLKSAEQSRNMYRYLMFLYAYMPQSDLADYDFSFFEQQVATAMEARSTFSWGKTIPDDISVILWWSIA